MEIAVVIIFIVGYLAITLEHQLRIDKLIPALAMMSLCWAVIALGELPVFHIEPGEGKHAGGLEEILLHHLGKTAEILVFLLGAMTIVEITDHFDGFATIKKFVRTNSKRSLLWIMCILAFVLSAIIDNLTATIVLLTILRKLVPNQTDRMWYAGLIIIAANAGGAWSPIGDVTTTMLWMAKKVSTEELIKYLLLPSIACMVVPTFVASFFPVFKGKFEPQESGEKSNPNSGFMLVLGLSAIIFVPIFKTITHLPPYVGMMLSLAVVATFAEILSKRKFEVAHLSKDHAGGAGAHGGGHGPHHNPVHKALSKIEMPSILFFLGILLGVAALESIGYLFDFAGWLDQSIPNQNIVVMLLGTGSAVIDNVPLVAASIGMFAQPMDDPIWHFIAYAAGTGGSMLIIGSAAGVVAMGMERISFFWYLQKIAGLAVIGFLVGCGIFILMH
jgi:Na+/H+ antiporter NhaD/arsenite permease-like protein